MDSMLQVFKNEDFSDWNIETLKINDEVYFKGKDVAIALEYQNTAKAIQMHVDDDDKSTYGKIITDSNIPFWDGCQRNEKTLYILQRLVYIV
jgi:prophage antirepressor-like protein